MDREILRIMLSKFLIKFLHYLPKIILQNFTWIKDLIPQNYYWFEEAFDKIQRKKRTERIIKINPNLVKLFLDDPVGQSQ